MNFTQLNELLKSQKKKISLTEDVVLDDGEEDIFEKGIVIDASNQLTATVMELMPEERQESST
ncbi:hypothetical protein [Methanobrevibacter sp.]|uniref:hypothetical protein n=1 Tax=Methanobrevibacter sp. TaxID=66852 RepID=UPI002E787094|nr:hypothetical protein [Methanobrevibacter sp.]MEE1336516.1 hypothetical protein [Methanobrevibacter sp.]